MLLIEETIKSSKKICIQCDYLINLGFKRGSCYPSFRWTDGNHSFHRLKFRGNSGYSHGVCKIWDCGQQKYIMEK